MILALDAGTTSTRAILFNEEGQSVAAAQKEFPQYYPKAGYVEHHGNEIWQAQLAAAREAVEKSGVDSSEIKAIGITNQRETTLVWDRETGLPIYPAIVWQCRRTTEMIEKMTKENPSVIQLIKEKTGLVFDPYFSATKLSWILNHVKGARERAEKGELCFGTVDTWLIFNLTKGKCFATDYSNASRTLLFNIHSLEWDAELCKLFRIPKCMLPEVRPSSSFFGETDEEYFGRKIPICGVAGDQQAALFGQCCFQKGDVKNTYGTGCFLLMNTGEKPVKSDNGLVTTIAWGINGKINYALEGSVFVAGASIQWLRDEMRLIDSSEDSEYMAMKVEDTNGCYVVPAFTGLGAPYWDQYARGTIVGITRGVNKYHIIRATLESMAYQVRDVLDVMEKDSCIVLSLLNVDGGASTNDFLMQTQADFCNVRVERPKCVETTALGVAYLAGLAVGFWNSIEDIKGSRSIDRVFTPNLCEEVRKEKIRMWKKAVKYAFGWAKED